MKSPCRGCDYELQSKTVEPCVSCPKPLEYDKKLIDMPIGGELIKESIKGPDMTTTELPEAKEIPAPEVIKKPAYRTCDVPGCNERHLAKGKCYKHYHQSRGNLESGKSKPRQKKDTGHSGSAVEIPAAIWKEIVEIAKKEYRDPERQIYYFLNVACQEYRNQRSTTQDG